MNTENVSTVSSGSGVLSTIKIKVCCRQNKSHNNKRSLCHLRVSRCTELPRTYKATSNSHRGASVGLELFHSK